MLTNLSNYSDKKFKELEKTKQNSGDFSLAFVIDPKTVGATINYNQHVFSKDEIKLLAFAQGSVLFNSIDRWSPNIQTQAGLKVVW